MSNMDDTILNIAKQHLNISVLENANSDSLDLHNVNADTIKAALEAAYKAGQESATVVKEQAVPALLKPASDEFKRIRELAGIPHKGNFV